MSGDVEFLVTATASLNICQPLLHTKRLPVGWLGLDTRCARHTHLSWLGHSLFDRVFPRLDHPGLLVESVVRALAIETRKDTLFSAAARRLSKRTTRPLRKGPPQTGHGRGYVRPT